MDKFFVAYWQLKKENRMREQELLLQEFVLRYTRERGHIGYCTVVAQGHCGPTRHGSRQDGDAI